jgi:[histone H3]-lysine36 N-trimethyltransferase
MRLRGFSLMTSILEDYATDLEICTTVGICYKFHATMLIAITQILESLPAWPLINRNKVEDSKIEVPLQAFVEGHNEKVKGLAEQVSQPDLGTTLLDLMRLL